MKTMDALNSLSLKDAELVKDYELFDPRLNMIISKNDGLFDNNFNLIKDQLICLHQFCKFGQHITKINITKIKDLVDNKEEVVINESKETQMRKINIKRIKE